LPRIFWMPGRTCASCRRVGHASIKNTVIYAQLTSRRRDEEARRVFMSPYVV
jgi:hypothetical protein